MLLVLAASSYRKDVLSGSAGVTLADLPRIAHEELGLRGLVTPTDFLKGADLRDLDAFRDAADKASCPVLTLIESEPHPLGVEGVEQAKASIDRLDRVLTAAHRLGCSSAAMTISGPATDVAMELAAKRMRPLATRAERLDLSLLIAPTKGLTETPERATDLIKKVGGFRIGSMPDFQAAAASEDPVAYLRRLSPYAPVVCASTVKFNKAGVHDAYDLEVCAEGLRSVGYDGAVALDYRGSGDITKGLAKSKELFERLLMGAES